MATETASRPYPLYSTTFTINRLSPLFHNNIVLDNGTLRQYASLFRDVLTGEVLRGVRVGLAADEETLARVGALKSVRWSLLRSEADWDPTADETQVPGEEATIQETDSIGISVEVTYEKSAYMAILLKDTTKTVQIETPSFTHYPLLLTRMPTPLRETFTSFLAATFDTRASVLKLPSHFLVESAERYLADITTGAHGPLDIDSATRSLRTTIKEILITLSFDVPGINSSLKTMDITISKDDTWQMIRCGRKLLQTEGNNNRLKTTRPFTRSLTHYVDGHLGLKLDNPHVRISRVACGAFVLGTEGKIKVFAPPGDFDEEDMRNKATEALVAGLIDLASGGKIVAMVDLT